eukprot:TRINITY_DN2156_c0_g2_i2.p1 TRINITY_DN2156_c0_g2~~TRINITY_DN2156_c0_g2_i2.p1  ORF type:complete len:538 (-),score=74.44 TRINITY_DN2156_c0_g2_i2:162-1775(-)
MRPYAMNASVTAHTTYPGSQGNVHVAGQPNIVHPAAPVMHAVAASMQAYTMPYAMPTVIHSPTTPLTAGRYLPLTVHSVSPLQKQHDVYKHPCHSVVALPAATFGAAPRYPIATTKTQNSGVRGLYRSNATLTPRPGVKNDTPSTSTAPNPPAAVSAPIRKVVDRVSSGLKTLESEAKAADPLAAVSAPIRKVVDRVSSGLKTLESEAKAADPLAAVSAPIRKVVDRVSSGLKTLESEAKAAAYVAAAPTHASPEEIVAAGIEIQEESLAELLGRATTGTILVKGVVASRLADVEHSWVDLGVKFLTRGFWTHGGIIVRDPPDHILELYGCKRVEPPVYLFESTVSVGGAALRPLVDVFAIWGGDYGITDDEQERKMWALCTRDVIDLGTGEPATADVLDVPAFWEWVQEARHKKYGFSIHDVRDLCKWYVTGTYKPTDMRTREEELKTLFCIEVVTESLMRLGAMTRTYGSSQFLPFFCCPMAPTWDVGELAVERNMTDHVALGPLVRVTSGVSAHVQRRAAEKGACAGGDLKANQ